MKQAMFKSSFRYGLVVISLTLDVAWACCQPVQGQGHVQPLGSVSGFGQQADHFGSPAASTNPLRIIGLNKMYRITQKVAFKLQNTSAATIGLYKCAAQTLVKGAWLEVKEDIRGPIYGKGIIYSEISPHKALSLTWKQRISRYSLTHFKPIKPTRSRIEFYASDSRHRYHFYSPEFKWIK